MGFEVFECAPTRFFIPLEPHPNLDDNSRDMKSLLVSIVAAVLLMGMNMFIPGFAFAVEDGLVFDAKLGHYKDLSYEVLSDKGLPWKERTQLFGGQTVHYGGLTDTQRLSKRRELEVLLATIKMRETSNWADPKLAERVETEIYTWLNAQIQNVHEKYAEANV